MIEKFEQLEETLGKKYEDWDMSTLVEIVEHEDTLKLFTPEVAAYLVNNKINSDIYDIMLPVKYGHYLREVKVLIDSYLNDLQHNKLTRDEFIVNIETLKCGKLFSKAIAYLTNLYMLEEVDILEDETEIQKCIDELLDIVDEVKIETGMELIADIMGIIEPIRTMYHQRYEIDLFDGMNLKEKYDGIIDRLNKASEEIVLDKIAQEAEDTGE